jgi:tetratricopeptide (TPR) repeat protein
MGFRDEFRATNRTQARLLLPEHKDDSETVTDEERLSALEDAVKSTIEDGIRRVSESEDESATVLQGELVYQAERISLRRSPGADDEAGTEATIMVIQRLSDYLGSALSEVRWSVERQATASEKMLETLLQSLGNDSRQFFEQGVKCYEAGEYTMARERFSRALEADRTNHFAYQYLGFIAVAENNEEEAIRSFDLARKFAGDDYHQALALTHLARSYHATDNVATAAEFARAATEAHPDTARFWYDRAGYNARLELRKQAISALREAIERDWTYWAIVINDRDFDAIRDDVYRLLAELRERERAKARQVIDDLQAAIETARQAGAEQELGDCVSALRDFEEQHRQNNVFIHRDHLTEVQHWHDLAFRIAEQTLEKRIADKQEFVARLIETSKRQEAALQSDKSRRRRRKRKSSSGSPLLSARWGVYLLWLIGWAVVCWKQRFYPPHLSQEVFAVLMLNVIFVPVILFFLWNLKRESRAETVTEKSNPSHRIEVDHSQALAALEQELGQLTQRLERCRQKQYS